MKAIAHGKSTLIKTQVCPVSIPPNASKNGAAWLINYQIGKVYSFINANPTPHAQWFVVEIDRYELVVSLSFAGGASLNLHRSMGDHVANGFLETVSTEVVISLRA